MNNNTGYHLKFFVVDLVRQTTQKYTEDWEGEMNGTSEARTFNNESITQSSTPAKFYRLPLPLDRIFVVDNSRSLRECMRTLCAVCLSMIYRILAKNGKYYSYGGQELQNLFQFLAVSHSCDKISATYADIQHSYSLSCICPLALRPFLFLFFSGERAGR